MLLDHAQCNIPLDIFINYSSSFRDVSHETNSLEELSYGIIQDSTQSNTERI